jgi:hypothetical protein
MDLEAVGLSGNGEWKRRVETAERAKGTHPMMVALER